MDMGYLPPDTKQRGSSTPGDASNESNASNTSNTGNIISNARTNLLNSANEGSSHPIEPGASSREDAVANDKAHIPMTVEDPVGDGALSHYRSGGNFLKRSRQSSGSGFSPESPRRGGVAGVKRNTDEKNTVRYGIVKPSKNAKSHGVEHSPYSTLAMTSNITSTTESIPTKSSHDDVQDDVHDDGHDHTHHQMYHNTRPNKRQKPSDHPAPHTHIHHNYSRPPTQNQRHNATLSRQSYSQTSSNHQARPVAPCAHPTSGLAHNTPTQNMGTCAHAYLNVRTSIRLSL
eukprot:18420-Amorphochlora_amoeboformis.AAC.3